MRPFANTSPRPIAATIALKIFGPGTLISRSRLGGPPATSTHPQGREAGPAFRLDMVSMDRSCRAPFFGGPPTHLIRQNLHRWQIQMRSVALPEAKHKSTTKGGLGSWHCNSSRICFSVARLAAASCSAACRRRSSILRLLNPIEGSSPTGWMRSIHGEKGADFRKKP